MMHWPKALVTELASRRCIVFLGAGASAACQSQDGKKNPPNWTHFLDLLMFHMKSRIDETIINEFKSKEKFLEAAEIIKKSVPSADFSTFIRKELVTPRYLQSKVHEYVLEIDPKVVVTTNYDEIYDNYCKNGSANEGYNVSRYYDRNIVENLRSPVRLIVKAHGCVSDPSQIVLTKSEYFKARQSFSSFYKILDALFLTHTILFLGYSLTDPDIQLVLENVNISVESAHPHYFVTGNNTNAAIKEAMKRAYNIEFIEFAAGDYDAFNDGLYELAESVKSNRIINPSV